MTTEPGRQSPSPWRWRIFPAAAIIAVGLLFLANNLGYDLAWLGRGNWWALLILLAALAPLTHAWEIYRARGRFDAEAAYCLVSAGAVALVASMFLFNLDWSVWWPLFVILGGLYTLVPHRHRCRSRYWYGGWYGGHDAGTDETTVKH